MTKHTPGPWEVSKHGYPGRPEISRQDNDRCNSFRVALVTQLSGHPLERNQESDANASLIAAAPEMLEALQTVLLRLDLEAKERGPGAVFPCATMRNDIRAIITKATGSPQTAPDPSDDV